MTTEPIYMTTYRQTWANLVETNGQLDPDKVARELSDYATLMGQVSIAYDAVTGSVVSKPHTSADVVELAARQYGNRIAAGALLDDLLPEMTDETDRQAVIDFAMGLDPESYTEYLNAQARKTAAWDAEAATWVAKPEGVTR